MNQDETAHANFRTLSSYKFWKVANLVNVLIIRPGALGDTLMILPALVDLEGKVDTTFVGRQPGLDFVRDFVYLSMDFEVSGWHRLFMTRPNDRGLPVMQTDLVIAFFSKEGSRLRQNLAFYFPRTPIHVFPSLPAKGKDVHSAHYISACLKLSGLPVDPERSMESAADRAILADKGKPRKRNRIVLHPGSGDLRKNHPPGFWLDLRDKLGREVGFRELDLVFLLGPAEAALVSLFEKNVRSPAKIHNCPDNGVLVDLLRGAALYIGHDSGVTHLSAMLGTPTVSLFKKSESSQWRPLGPCVKVIRNQDPGPELVEKVIQVSRVFIV